jgi:hypothetical protein
VLVWVLDFGAVGVGHAKELRANAMLLVRLPLAKKL